MSMNAEALIGTVLGTCTLQKLVGQGGMGAVFLAQQSRPRRQVAVKILLPMAPLSPNQLAAFLERFRRETDAAASLEHPNIVPVHEYGERDGLAYLVMPYINGGTLRDQMEREGPLPMPTVVNYLDQMAAALDFAHGHGVIHRDIKPANILLTSERRLLLTDFGLVKIVAEGRVPQIRLTGEGAPVGTPDYMAPEQVIGEDVDARADLYSLGVIVYQMVTGTTPFQGETPMQIAAQHLQVPPPPPHLLRLDLPLSVEQVILKALSKRPSDRYKSAQELTSAFRQALEGTGFVLGLSPDQGGALSTSTSSRLFVPQNLPQQSTRRPAATLGSSDLGFQFRPTGMMPAINATGTMPSPTGSVPTAPTSPRSQYSTFDEKMPQSTNAFPVANGRGGLLSKTGMFPAITSSSLPATSNALPTPTEAMPTTQAGGGLLSRTGRFPTMGSQVAPTAGSASSLFSEQHTAAAMQQLSPTAPRSTTGALQDSPPLRTTMKLSTPMKVVKVPVAGQPGHFVTGLLSMADGNAEDVALPEKKGLSSRVKVLSAVLALLIIFGAIGGVWAFTHGRAGQNTKSSTTAGVVSTPDAKATALVQATAAAQANTILSDPLDHNIHGWYESANDGYVFEDGAYHIINHNADKSSATVLPSFSYTGPMAYTLTMQEIKGDDTSDVNSFGMLFRYSQQTAGKNTVSTFYSFEILNKPGGEYKFWKYDSSKGVGAAAWGDPLWHQPFGNEFHQGHGAQAVNTVKIIMDGSKFTFIVNGKTIKTVVDNSYANGSVGMIVNLNGTEVDFKNLLLTKN
jgi:eukaryotic-like serine/threonine-protein kinase